MILVTGGTGYLGGILCNYLTQEKFDIKIATRNIVSKKKPNLCQIDLLNEQNLDLISRNTEAVIHLAAMNDSECNANSDKAKLVNEIGTKNLLDAIIKNKVKKFIYFSTSHVYGKNLIGNVSEKVNPMPISNYAITHHNAEKHILDMLEYEQIDYLILRLSNVVGVPTSDKVKCWHLVVNDLCKQAIEQRQIKLRSTGQQLRDFVGTSELLEAIKIFLDNNKISGIYNYGSGTSISIKEIAFLIQTKCEELFKFKPEIFFGNYREEKFDFNYDVSKFKNEFKNIKILEIQKSIEKVLLYCKNK